MIKRQYLHEQNSQNLTTHGYLSFDLGYKHMAAAYTIDFENFNIFLFDIDSSDKFHNRLNQIKLNINKIIQIIGQLYSDGKQNISFEKSENEKSENEKSENEKSENFGYTENDFDNGKSKIKTVIIEEQVQTNIQSLNIMYALGMYFDIHKIQYCIQPARLKYKIFENRDSRQFKNLSAQYVGERLNKIKIKYQNYDAKPFQNHKWMNDEFRDWMQYNKIDKADDIGDVILILKYHNEQQKLRLQQEFENQKKKKIKQ